MESPNRVQITTILRVEIQTTPLTPLTETSAPTVMRVGAPRLDGVLGPGGRLI